MIDTKPTDTSYATKQGVHVETKFVAMKHGGYSEHVTISCALPLAQVMKLPRPTLYRA